MIKANKILLIKILCFIPIVMLCVVRFVFCLNARSNIHASQNLSTKYVPDTAATLSEKVGDSVTVMNHVKNADASTNKNNTSRKYKKNKIQNKKRRTL